MFLFAHCSFGARWWRMLAPCLHKTKVWRRSMNISFNILLRVAEASLERKLSDLSARSPKHLHTLNSEGPTSSIPDPLDPLGTNEAPLKVVGKTTLAVSHLWAVGVYTPKSQYGTLRGKSSSQPRCWGSTWIFFFEGGVTNYIVSEKNVRNSSTHDVLRLRPNGRHLELWMCCLGDGHC